MNGTLFFSVKLNESTNSDTIKSNVVFHNCEHTGHRATEDEVSKVNNEKYQLKQEFQLDNLGQGGTRLRTDIRDGRRILGTIEIPVTTEMRQAINARAAFEQRGEQQLFDPARKDQIIGTVKWKFVVTQHQPLKLPKKKKKKRKPPKEVAPADTQKEESDVPKKEETELLDLPKPKEVFDEPDMALAETELSKSGRRELEVLVHCATNIYKRGTRDPPCAFVSFKSWDDHEANKMAQSSTGIAEESLVPEWGEIVKIYFSASEEAKAILKIIDADDRETLHTFTLETAHFQPHVNYNIELVNETEPKTTIYISVFRKHHLMEAQSLEMVICRTDNFANKDDISYHMVVRPVTDARHYREKLLAPVINGTESESVIKFERLTSGQIPSIPKINPASGYPFCLPKSTQPLVDGPIMWWHGVILRQQCLSEMFIEGAGIVIEIYHSRILAPNQNEVITPRPPVAVAEIRMNYVERELLLKLSNGIRLSQIAFPKLHLDQTQFPELTVAMRLVPRNQKRILSRATVDDIQHVTVDQLSSVYNKQADHLLNLDTKQPATKKKSMFDVAEEVLNIIRGECTTPSDAETVATIDLKPVNKKEVALIALSRDFLALRAATDAVEDENAKLKGQINQLILNEREKEIFLAKGLENTKPAEMAQEYITLRRKQKKMEEENSFLRHKVNEFENNLKIGVSQLSDMNAEFDQLKASYDEGEVRLAQLRRRLKSQRKLEELALGKLVEKTVH